MSVVQLHLIHIEDSTDFGELRLAVPPGDEGGRLIVWDGIPPAPVRESPLIAPTVLQGDSDGRRVYAERVPRGMRLSEMDLPPALAPLVASRIVQAVAHLHATQAAHAMVHARRVLIGTDGRVVLFGRGRRPGTQDEDLASLLTVLRDLGLRPPDGSLEEMLEVLKSAIGPEDGEALAALVATELPPTGTLVGQLTVRIGPSADSLDEVLPDIGSDPIHERGLFDPYTSASTTDDGERTAELHPDEVPASAEDPLALSLWTRLAAPRRDAGAASRFRAVAGEPSAALRALVLAEAPATLPASIGGVIAPFMLLDHDDEDTPAWPMALSGPDTTPGPREVEGDTAVYDASHPALRAARKTAAAETRLASLEARLAEAERKADGDWGRPPASEPAWRRFLKVEVIVAAMLGALLMWLLQRLVG